MQQFIGCVFLDADQQPSRCLRVEKDIHQNWFDVGFRFDLVRSKGFIVKGAAGDEALFGPGVLRGQNR